MNAFIAGIITELNAGSADKVEFSHFDSNRKMVVSRKRTGKFYTYIKDCRGKFIFMPVL